MGKTVPNQKTVKIEKEVCNKQNLYAAINLQAMESAAINLDAGAFKLWCYFAKNQNNYEFALSSKDVAESFGIKIKQYNNAVNELMEKGYLVNTKGNNYVFHEISVNTKSNNDVITKEDNAVITKSNNELLPLDIRNNTDNTYNTINNTDCECCQGQLSLESQKQEEKEEGTIKNPIPVEKEWLLERYNHLQTMANGLFYYNHKFYVMR